MDGIKTAPYCILYEQKTSESNVYFERMMFTERSRFRERIRDDLDSRSSAVYGEASFPRSNDYCLGAG